MAVEVRSGVDGSRLCALPDPTRPVPERVIAAAAAGDVDQDGKDDLIVTVVGANDVTMPLVRIVLGGSGQTFRAFQCEIVNNCAADIWGWPRCFGSVVGSIGDVDGDGRPDYFVAAPEQRLDGPGNAGKSEMLGKPYRECSGNGFIDVYSAKQGNRLWRQGRINAEHGFAYSAAAIGDVNGDGVPDLVVGAPPSGIGLIYQPIVSEGGFFALSGRDGEVLSYSVGRRTDDAMGRSVIAVGDIDGDRAVDVAVGAGSDETDQVLEVVIARARDGEILRSIDQSFLRECCAASIRAAGDLDGDGRSDLVVYPGHRRKQVQGAACGAVRVIDPRSGRIVAEWSVPDDATRFGSAAGSAGDANGDGRDDLAVCESLLDQDGRVSALIRVYMLEK
jgi:hypothetical protein